MALDAAGGQSTKYDEVAGIYVANNNQNVVINADNINLKTMAIIAATAFGQELQLQILR